MRPTLSGLFAVFVVSAMTCAIVSGQGTAQISGTVEDQSGALLPGVEIIATQTDTGVSRMTVTNETGLYVLPNLPLGAYKIEATLPGFRSFVQTGIVLQVNTSPTVNIVLQVGQVSEQVEVQANASLVETRSVSVGQVMESARITELPLNGRNAQELLLLGGGAVQTAPAGGQTFPGRLTISAAGALSTATEYSLDGVKHVDPFDGIPMVLPFPDALGEFKTEIGGISAQAAGGSQVSAVTKSGTNDFHGDLFEFVRNDLFNARPYFAIKGSTLKRNQFGGTLGGAMIKNKLFFFGGYQGTTLRQDASDQRQFVPTAAMLAGDFTAVASAACNSKGAVSLKAPFVNNRINPSSLSPLALKVAAQLPKSDDPCGLITFGRRNVENDGQYVGKVDYQKSAKHSLFGRYMFSKVSSPSPFTFSPDNVLNAQQATEPRAHAFTAGSTYLIGPAIVNAFRLGFSRDRTDTPSPQFFDLSELGARIFSGYTPKVAAMSVNSGFTLPGGGPRSRGVDFYQIADDVSIVRGSHQLGFGGRVAHSRTISGTLDAPTYIFDGTITGMGLADYLVGKPSEFDQSTANNIFTRVNYLSLHAEDTWQAKRRLTMSYGLRWSPILPHHDVHRPVPYVMTFDVERYRQGIRSTVFVNAPPGISFPGDPGFPMKNNGANADKPRADLWNAYWKDFAPRIGFAWDVEGNGRTSLRASYGLSYFDYPTIDRLGTQQGMPPYGNFTRVVQPAGGFEDPWLGVPGGNPFPLQINKNMPFVPFSEYMFRRPDLSPTYSQNWNLSLQREVVKDTLVSLSYIGSQTVHLQIADPLNLSVYVPGVGDASGRCFLNGKETPFKVAAGAACSTVANTQDRRQLSFVNPAYSNEIGRMAVISNPGTQQYHGMLLSVQRRLSSGFSVNGNYTFSHCVGDYQARTNNGYGTSDNHTYQDPNNRRRDRGNCEVDQRHTLNLTALGETPKFGNRTLSLVGTGWRLSGIYRASTAGTIVASSAATGVRTVTIGQPAASKTSGTGGDRCLCDISSQRPDQILPDVYLDKSGRPGTLWLNPAALGLPTVGTLGNLGRSTLKLPLAWQFDVSLARVFRVRENQSMEFRAEAYNVLNSFRTGAISTDLSSAQFGVIRNALDPRILQFALKYLF